MVEIDAWELAFSTLKIRKKYQKHLLPTHYENEALLIVSYISMSQWSFHYCKMLYPCLNYYGHCIEHIEWKLNHPVVQNVCKENSNKNALFIFFRGPACTNCRGVSLTYFISIQTCYSHIVDFGNRGTLSRFKLAWSKVSIPYSILLACLWGRHLKQ